MSIVPQKGKVAVIGGGISGLTYAYFLGKLRPDLQIQLYEKSDRLGGYIRSKKLFTTEYDSRASQDYTILEKGPRTVRGGSSGIILLLDLLFKFKAQNDLLGISGTSLANRRYLVSPYVDTEGHSGKLTPVPYSVPSFLRFLFDPLGRGLVYGLLKEPFVRSKMANDETVEQFVTRRFNKSVSDNVVSAIMHGVYAGDAGKLSAKSVLPQLVDIEAKHGSIVRYYLSQLIQTLQKKKPEDKLPADVAKYAEVFKPSFNLEKTTRFLRRFPVLTIRDGLETLVTLLHRNLPENVTVKLNTGVTSVSSADNGLELELSSGDKILVDNVESTVSGASVASFINNPELSSLLGQIKYSSVLVVNVYLPAFKLLSHSGFGFLVPKSMQDETQLLGVIFDSEIEQNSRRLLFYNDVSTELTSPQPVSDENLGKLVQAVSKRGSVITNSYTKLTLMIGGHQFKSNDDLPTKSRVNKIVRDVLLSKLHIDLDKCNGTEEVEVEYVVDGIPQYEVGHSDRKHKILEVSEKEFQGKLVLGGTSVGDGVGVPDCIVKAFKDAYKVSGHGN
ncbi:hypothetical protein OGAPHI_005724 [Ogataea philodendri]|uniref:Protoporphyrinogen oxidase n=1 Tax=Ogataea philodendri TaxID=1378263 RepID=A0A9P8P0A1_9ASCO|nr:uncharacterized protein OGAPHI_005724 [Ogataea philodendri]KAH3662472.1 hypothetical protein OGAPHI_005724 [Ogataea philodendri]